jgi:Carbohydrate esterase, sialic acid-specific acetylesterase
MKNLGAMIARRLPHCALVTAEELKDMGDSLHFDAVSLRLFGKRYAAAWLELKGKPAAVREN